MELVQPGVGLVFWMTVSFAILIFILARYAWKPIMNGLKERENSIEEALKAAELAREEMARLQADNEQLIREAKDERDALLKEARALKEKMIGEAREKADQEAQRILDSARESIENEKKAAIYEMKSQMAALSIEIAEKILREELSDRKKHEKLVEKLIADISKN
ncbi:MAG: F0F1 ATP synthase subunit B [Bacteroidales bacterium]